MVAYIILVLIVLCVCYAYTNHNREFNATASAIQQIWSGSCRLSCRNSQCSGFSGLSGLVQNPESGLTGHLSTSCDCVCDSCPCTLVENVLKTCRPATNVYSRLVEFISDCYYDVVKTLTDLYNYLEQVMLYQGSGQRQAQLISINQLNSGANINFVNKVKDELEKRKATVSSNLKRSKSITFRRESDAEKFTDSSIIFPSVALNVEVSEPAIPTRGSEEKIQIVSNCSRCMEKDMTCIGKCPRAKKE